MDVINAAQCDSEISVRDCGMLDLDLNRSKSI